MDRIATYYNRKNENQRLFSGRGELEFLRTKQIIEQFLLDETGLSIADVGGGSGPYAFWLAEKGHKVALEMIDRTDRDRSLLGASGHNLLVVKRGPTIDGD